MKRKWIIVVLLLCLILGPIIVNDYNAYRIKEELFFVPLPLDTEMIDSISKAGKLNGNGNGMQYFGAILIKSDLSIEELDYYYKNQNNRYHIERQLENVISVIEHEKVFFHEEMDYQNDYYIVYCWGEGIEFFELFDLRGH